MSAYMASLAKLRGARRGNLLAGPRGSSPRSAPLRAGRSSTTAASARSESSSRLKAGDDKVEAIVAATYETLDPRLARAAAMSVLAHLEDLIGRGLVVSEGEPGLAERYRAA